MQFFCKTTTSCFIFVMYLILERIESLPDDGQGMSSSNNGNCSANTFCVPCMKSNLGCKWCVKTRTCSNNDCQTEYVVKGGENFIGQCHVKETCDIFNTSPKCFESSQFYDCGWCISKNNCTNKTDCSSSGDSPWIIKRDIVENSLFKIVNATDLRYGESENILLHSKIKYSNTSLVQAAFKCQLTSENQKLNFAVNATIETKQNDTMVSCLLPKSNDILLLPPENFNATANISLYTNAIQTLPIWSTNVTFLDCRAYSAKRKCMKAVQCHWCKDEEKCIYRSSKKIVCPNSPSSWIDSFWPEKGLLQGATNITILGENFEIKFENYQKAIKVAGIPCKSIQYKDITSKKIECTIEPSSSFQVSEGKIEVHVDEQVFWSDKIFMFVEPNITDIDPKEGFYSGGTELTIKGEHLDAGSSINVSIGSQPCTIFFYNSSIIQCISSKSNTTAEEDTSVSVVFDKYAPNFTNNSYKYIKDEEHDENGFNVQPKGIPKGGIQILLQNITTPEHSNESIFNVGYQGNLHNGPCKFQDNSTVMCSSPVMPINSNSINVADPMKFDFWLTDPSVPERNISIAENQSSTFLLYPNPRFDYFSISYVPLNRKHYVIVEGKNINKACQKSDLIVKMENATCEVISLSSIRVICVLPKFYSSECTQAKCDIKEDGNIMIEIGNNFTASVHKKNSTSEENVKNLPSWDKIIYAAIGTAVIGTIFLILIIVCLCVNRKKSNTKMRQDLMKKQQQVDQLELRVAAECKEAFAELQTLTTALTSDLTYDSALFLDYRSYVMKILFSTISSYPVILGENPILINKAKGLKLFEELVMDRRFLLMFVKTLESQNSFSMNDRVYVASMLMMTLQKDMQFATNILKTLMSELIDSYIRDNKQPKLLFRSTENVVEKMISAWLSFLLHRFLKKSAGKPLLSLFNAIDQQVKNGPVDMITSEARYGLSENKIMRQKIDFTSLTVLVNVSKSTASIINLPKAVEKLPVKVLDCDTITQVKEKIIGAIFYSVRYSKRPNLQEISIEWIAGPTKWIYLSDQDSSSKIEGEWRQLNTLKHYGVFDKSILYLTSIHQEKDNVIQTTTSDSNSKNSYKRERYTPLSQFDTIKRKSAVIDSVSASIKNHNGGCREWHLVKPRDRKDSVDNDRDNHVIPEIYFTRLLAMKGGLQKYVDDLFETIFSKTHQHDCFPLAVKCMFDFLDGQALQHGITDPEVVHVWKNNCLPLRFWVNLIKNPEFLFDVHKSSVVDSCLSVIAQVLMDSCSTTEQCLNKNSSTSKLLYAKEIPVYKKLVGKYYADIRNMPATSQREMNIMLAEESRIHAADFDKNSPLYELCKYALKYRTELTVALDGDATSQSYSLPFKFHRLINIMSAEPDLGFLRPIRRESFSSS